MDNVKAAAALRALADAIESPAASPLETKPTRPAKATKDPAIAQAAATPAAAAPAAQAAAVGPSLKQVADAFTALANSKGRDAVIQAFKSLGIEKLPQLKPESYKTAIDAANAALTGNSDLGL